ncbi:alpha/beta hydrolase [Funiculus sociatus GB2-A5]|uniref:Alpha/beta hydrolase n=1 Tax=Funiculus sociatus GB2-A5 TaxID=2933946 RepID=A0ABV0JJV5_9CYAN|nr:MULTISPECIES: alpha/beta fold hydrolase [unclassified Trichocoleus]MBD1908709.1 alpha/beta hydrolase [Trichocoleus sp. FACHB-832]MBD2063331.1 alpha/beta hydrolase [Trichocoleus sp. FACHB-6]
MSNYFSLTSAIIRETKAHEDALPLMDEGCRSRFLLHQKPTEKVCLFFHGFTASPEQFVPIGEAFFKAGYNVLIPLLPGHGIAGEWDADNPPPLPENQQVYQEFGLRWLDIVQPLGTKVIVGGLSGGSTLAAWLALERNAQINRALLFAPYLSGSNKVVDLFVEIFNIYFKWRTEPGLASFGYPGFLMPSLRVFLDMGQDILGRAEESLAAPMFIISSESDRAVGKEEHEALFEAALKSQPFTWYHSFDRVLDVPHNMMTKAEGNDHLDLLIAIAKAYVESGLTWAEVQEISSRMKQGYSFDTVVDELHLRQLVPPNFAPIIARL